MTELQFPNNITSNFYYAHKVGATIISNTYFPIRRINGLTVNSTLFPKTITTNMYEHLKYIDLDQSIIEDDPTNSSPFLKPLDPFTIVVKMNIDIQGTPSDYFNKSRIFFSIGQHVAGNKGGVITVGTNAYDSSNKMVPVLGMIDKDGVHKSTPSSDAISIDSEGEYTFRLVFNPVSNDENQILLFFNEGTDDEVVQCNGTGLPIHNYNISKPRLYLFTSGWINEWGWNGTYDYAYGSIDTDRSLRVINNVEYPQDFLLSKLDELTFQTNFAESGEEIESNSGYVAGTSKIGFYISNT